MERALVSIGFPKPEFSKWAGQSRGELFYMQTFVDLRSEQRWLPDFVMADQLKAEFIGRISAAANANIAKLKTTELKELLSRQDRVSIKSELKFPYAFLPGPLEGAVESIVVIPPELETQIVKALGSEELTPKSFANLINNALIVRIELRHALLAAQALRRVKYQIMQVQGSDEAFSLLSGLADGSRHHTK